MDKHVRVKEKVSAAIAAVSKDDPLLPYLYDGATPKSSSSSKTGDRVAHVRQDLLTQGLSVIPCVLTGEECAGAVNLLWDFVEDVSGGTVLRSDSSTWYPDGEQDDPWPHSSGHDSCRVDMCQSLGAGFVLGPVRELLAERVFEPLYGGIKELYCSKEGFIFQRPILVDGTRHDVLKQAATVCGKDQLRNLGEHCKQPHNKTRGLYTIRASVTFLDQHECDGHFVYYPSSCSHAHPHLTNDTCTEQFRRILLTDVETQTKCGLQPHSLYVKAGDVILWRSDVVLAAVPPAPECTNLGAIGYVSMTPAVLCTQPCSSGVMSPRTDKSNAYLWGRTGDHDSRIEEENWHDHKIWVGIYATGVASSNRSSDTIKKEEERSSTLNWVLARQRPHFRFSPPLVSVRLAQLYGLLPYGLKTADEMQVAMQKAIKRGVRFIDSSNNVFEAHRPLRVDAPLCDAHVQTIKLSRNELMLGQNKYLGGMSSPCGRYVYGCPGTAKRVLRVNTATNEMDYIGPSFSGQFKWLRGVEVPTNVMNMLDNNGSSCENNNVSYSNGGCCIALPCNAKSILKINPETNEVKTFGNLVELGETTDGWLYHGGSLAADGFVYAIPANATRVLKIDPRKETIELIGPSYPGQQKWYGGTIGSDGCIYGIPQNASGVLKIDPFQNCCSLLGEGTIPEGEWKWHGGLATADKKKIICFPNNADTVLIIDVENQIVYTIGNGSILKSGRHRIPQDNGYKYLGGALSLDGRYSYLFPCDAERVLRIDTVTEELTLVGPELLEGSNKFQNGFVARDGCLYGIPQRASGVLRIIPAGVVATKRRSSLSCREEKDANLCCDELLLSNNNGTPSLLHNKEEESSDHVDVLYCGEELVTIKDKFEGGVMGLDGNMYCVPLRAKALLKIIPGPAVL